MFSRRPSRLTNDAEKAIAVKASAMHHSCGLCVSTWATMMQEISRSERKTNVVLALNRCVALKRATGKERNQFYINEGTNP